MRDKNAALFLDRDGTIIKDNGYIGNVNKVKFYPFTFEALKKAQTYFTLFIITNQAGIGKGLVTVDEVEAVNNHVIKVLSNNGIKIEALYYCPHRKEDDCQCRKPKTYFIDYAVKKYGLDVTASFVIGDHPSDVMLAKNAGMNGIYVLSGHGQKHRDEINGDVIVRKNLYYAVDFIIKRDNRE